MPLCLQNRISLDRLCRLYGQHNVCFVIDVETHTVFAKRPEQEHVVRLLSARSETEAGWERALQRHRTSLRLEPFAKLDLACVFRKHILGIEKSKCIRVPEGRCVNVEDENGKVVFSFKAPKEFYACGNGNEICVEIEQTNKLTIFDQPNCKGTQREREETLLFCQPA
jgi:hypothetical protein